MDDCPCACVSAPLKTVEYALYQYRHNKCCTCCVFFTWFSCFNVLLPLPGTENKNWHGKYQSVKEGPFHCSLNEKCNLCQFSSVFACSIDFSAHNSTLNSFFAFQLSLTHTDKKTIILPICCHKTAGCLTEHWTFDGTFVFELNTLGVKCVRSVC